MLSIIVCVKQVPDTQKAVFDPKTGAIDRSATDNIMNPDDRHALEMALALKDSHGATLCALTMGPPHADEVLYEACALGADRGVLLSDPRFAGADSLATSRALSRAIERLGPFDIIVTGREAIDGNTGHVAYQLSEFLDAPLVSQIHRIRIDGAHAIIERQYGHEYQTIRCPLPALLSVGSRDNRVRHPRLADIAAGAVQPIRRMTMDDIGGSESDYGASGSPTIVIGAELFSHTRGREALPGGTAEKVEALVHRLKKHSILRY